MRKRQEPPSHILQIYQETPATQTGRKMLPEIPHRSNLYHYLYAIEASLAQECQGRGCPFCGSPLHHSDYMRKPRGGPDNLPEELMRRFSLCCSNRGCRRRVLPPSVLFMGRRVYWANVILVLVTVCQNKPQEYSKAALMSKFGMCRATLNNWITWFRDFFPHTDEWRSIRGLVHSSVSDSCLPFRLMNHFHVCCKGWQDAVIKCLELLAFGHKHAK